MFSSVLVPNHQSHLICHLRHIKYCRLIIIHLFSPTQAIYIIISFIDLFFRAWEFPFAFGLDVSLNFASLQINIYKPTCFTRI